MIIGQWETGSGCVSYHVSIVDQVQIPSRDDDYFWQGAIKNLDKELELYDLFQDAENMKIEETQQHVTIRWQPRHAL